MANQEKSKTIAVLIAYKAVKTLEKFYAEFPKELVDEIILVDDASGDGTFELAQKLGIISFKNEKNLGYGGNMKRHKQMWIGNVPASDKLPSVSKMMRNKEVAKIMKLRARREKRKP